MFTKNDRLKRLKQCKAKKHWPVHEVVKQMNQAGSGIMLIVDSKDVLLGIFTDADFRRLAGDDSFMKQRIETVMNQDPVVAKEEQTQEELIHLIRNKLAWQLPVVDNLGRVTDILFGSDLIQNGDSKPEKTAVIMAGGKGSRLWPLTADCPKPLLPISGRPILEGLLIRLACFGFSEIYISLHHFSDQLRHYLGDGKQLGVNIHYLEEAEPMGTCGSLGKLKEEFKDSFLVINADIVTKLDFEDLYQSHLSSQAFMTVCVREHEYQIPFGVLKTKKGRLASFEEKPRLKADINAGIYMISPKVLQEIPENNPQDMDELIQTLLKQKKHVNVHSLKEYWIDVGYVEDYERANDEWKAHFA